MITFTKLGQAIFNIIVKCLSYAKIRNSMIAYMQNIGIIVNLTTIMIGLSSVVIF